MSGYREEVKIEQNTRTSSNNSTTLVTNSGFIIGQNDVMIAQDVTRNTDLDTIATKTTQSNVNETAMITELEAINGNTATIGAGEAGFGYNVRAGNIGGVGFNVTATMFHGYLEDLKETESLLVPAADINGSGSFFINRGVVQTFWIHSDDVGDSDDKLAGNGAQIVTITGITTGFVEVSEPLEMNGLTAVATANQYFNINSAVVSQVGSLGVNTGNLFITGNQNSPFQFHISVAAQGNTGFLSHYQVPVDREYFLTSITLATSVAGTTQEIRVQIYRHETNGITYRTGHAIIAAGGEFAMVTQSAPKLTAGCILFFTVTRSKSTTTLSADVVVQGFLKETAIP